jgi:hypothetical protein
VSHLDEEVCMRTAALLLLGIIGCGGSTDEIDATSTSSSEAALGRSPTSPITICHATGSEETPYVEITISFNALGKHLAHQGTEDIFFVPEGGCPGPTPEE